MGRPLEFRILGPLEVTVGGQRLHLGGPRRQTVLATLLLDADRVVPVDHLVAAVWGDEPPVTARNQVAGCVSALRRAFEQAAGRGDVITTDGPGYVVRSEVGQLDARLAEDRVMRAREIAQGGGAEEAVQLYRAALALWRGPVLAGLGGPTVAAGASRWEEFRLSVLEEFAKLELGSGRHDELIVDLSALVREHPLHERARAQLMLALYRAGRQADALQVYHEGRRLLIEKLGLEPGVDLRHMHEAILRGDASVQPPVPPDRSQAPEAQSQAASTAVSAPSAGPDIRPAQLPPDPFAFTGRRQALRYLDDLLSTRSDDGHLPICIVSGIGGVGKTGVAIHWAHSVAERFPDGQLFADLRGYDEYDQPTPPGTVLERFLRALGVRGEQIPADLETRTALYRSVLRSRQILVVLDNAASAAQVRPLIPGYAGCFVIVTSRRPLDGLVARDGAHSLALDVLTPEEASELLAQIAGAARVAADPAGAIRLGELCNRLPLALRIAAAKLATRPRLTVAGLVARLADERRRIDELSAGELKIRPSIALSYRGLPPPARTLFRRLGLLSVPDFAAWTCAALLDATISQAEELTEQLVDAQLVHLVGSDQAGQARYRLHDLVRLFARERAHAEERAVERTAAVMRAFGCLLSYAEQAHLGEYGAHSDLIHGNAPRWQPDSPTPEPIRADPLAWLEAERAHMVAAVHQSAALGLDEICWDLVMTSITVFEAHGHFADWRESTELALRACRDAGNRRGTAAMLFSLATLHNFQQHYDEAEAVLAQAVPLFEQVGEQHGRALALRAAALIDRVRGDFETALRRYEHACEVLRAVGDRGAAAHVLGSMANIRLEQGRPDLAESLLDQALVVYRTEGNRRGAAQARYRRADVLVQQGRFDEAIALYHEVLAGVRRGGDQIGEAYVLHGLGAAMVERGCPHEAEAVLGDALRVAQKVGERFVEGRVRLSLGLASKDRGEPMAATDHFRAAHEVFAAIGAEVWRAKVESAARGR